jgi:hypothetical protein
VDVNLTERVGSAVANGFISACTPDFRVCGSEQDHRTIDLR